MSSWRRFLNHKPLKSIWVFQEGKFMGCRWVLAEEGQQQDFVSAPPLAAISADQNHDAVNAGLSEELSRKKA